MLSCPIVGKAQNTSRVECVWKWIWNWEYDWDNDSIMVTIRRVINTSISMRIDTNTDTKKDTDVFQRRVEITQQFKQTLERIKTAIANNEIQFRLNHNLLSRTQIHQKFQTETIQPVKQ